MFEDQQSKNVYNTSWPRRNWAMKEMLNKSNEQARPAWLVWMMYILQAGKQKGA